MWADVLYAADARWWRVYGEEVLRTFNGELWAACVVGGGLGDDWRTVPSAVRSRLRFVEVVDEPGLCSRPGRVHSGLNSGYQAIGMACGWWGASATLIGYDMKRGPKAETHHHGDHEGGLPNLGDLAEWARRMGPLAADLNRAGVSVLNATRDTAITAFERVTPEVAFAVKPKLVLRGHHGLGDNLHQRAIVRELMRTREVWLRTPWPQLYHDLPGLHLLPLSSSMYWMAKNEARNFGLYASERPPSGTPEIANSYPAPDVKATGSVLGAMAKTCGVAVGDFRMPIPGAWDAKASALLEQLRPKRPLLIYRPLVELRNTSGGSARAKVARNPEFRAYHALIEQIASRYFVVSVSDAVRDFEDVVGIPLQADATFHYGELDIETLAALTARASLVFTSPCFLTVLAQVVSAPMVCVFGGYEDARSFSAGARYSPWLPIEPINACACWSPGCTHDKTIDLPAALARIESFVASQPCELRQTRKLTGMLV